MAKFVIAQSKRKKVKTVVLERVFSMESYEFYVGEVPGSKNLMFGAFDAQDCKQIGFLVPFDKARLLAEKIKATVR